MTRNHNAKKSELKRLPSEQLIQIDPNPVSLPKHLDTVLPTDEHKGSSSPPPSNAVTLRWLQAAQKYSSYVFTGFFSMHVAAVVVAPVFSVSAGDAAMQFTNVIYQSPLVEPWLVYGSLGTHIVAGTALRIYRVYTSKKHYGKYWSSTSRLSPLSLSGYVLTPFVLGHLLSTRVVPEHVFGDSSLITLQYITNSIAQHPVMIWSSMAPLIVFSFYHVAFGYKRWLKVPPKKWAKQIYGGIAVLTSLGFASLMRIAAQAPASGWLATQYEQVSKLIVPSWAF